MPRDENGRKRHANLRERIRIIEARARGESFEKIARELDMATSTALRIHNDWKEKGKIEAAPRPGRPRKNPESADRIMVRISNNHPRRKMLSTSSSADPSAAPSVASAGSSASPAPRPRAPPVMTTANAMSTTHARFASLPPRARHDFLSKLSESFAPSDWWHLHSLFMARYGFYDILGRLPLELTMHVIGHLFPLDLVRLRRVSRSWNSLLTSSEVCFAASRLWYQTDSAIAARLRQPEGNHPPWSVLLENALSRDLAFRTGRVACSWKLHGHRAPEGWPTKDMPYAYNESRQLFAWISADKRTFNVQNLVDRTFLFKDRVAPQRESLYHIILLESYVVAMVTKKGLAYLWSLDTGDNEPELRLPSANFSEIYHDGNVLVAAILHSFSQDAKAIVCSVLLYDAVHKQSTLLEGLDIGNMHRYADNPRNTMLRLEKVLVDVQRQQFTTIVQIFKQDPQPLIYRCGYAFVATTFSFAGVRRSQAVSKLYNELGNRRPTEPVFVHEDSQYNPHAGGIHPVLWQKPSLQRAGYPILEKDGRTLYYDANACAFRERACQLPDLLCCDAHICGDTLFVQTIPPDSRTGEPDAWWVCSIPALGARADPYIAKPRKLELGPWDVNGEYRRNPREFNIVYIVARRLLVVRCADGETAVFLFDGIHDRAVEGGAERGETRWITSR